MKRTLLWGATGALALAAVAMTAWVATADPVDPRTQTVSWTNNPDFAQFAMHLSVTSNAPMDKRINTTITRAADGLVVCASKTKSVFDPTDMGEPGSPLTTDETDLTLDSHASGTTFVIQSQFYDALDNLTAAKTSTWTKP
ncbi:MAG: hypothetical protein K8T90_09270 [Planctomycetes bacterium]|nr:hypothetical protein [Planctomycetota bacterium]